MPLGKDVGKNLRELEADNKKRGKARGQGGKPRSREQMLAIAQERGGVRLVGKTEDVAIRPGDEPEHTANALEGAA